MNPLHSVEIGDTGAQFKEKINQNNASIETEVVEINNKLKPATTSSIGLVKPDDTSISVATDGTISATISHNNTINRNNPNAHKIPDIENLAETLESMGGAGSTSYKITNRLGYGSKLADYNNNGSITQGRSRVTCYSMNSFYNIPIGQIVKANNPYYSPSQIITAGPNGKLILNENFSSAVQEINFNAHFFFPSGQSWSAGVVVRFLLSPVGATDAEMALPTNSLPAGFHVLAEELYNSQSVPSQLNFSISSQSENLWSAVYENNEIIFRNGYSLSLQVRGMWDYAEVVLDTTLSSLQTTFITNKFYDMTTGQVFPMYDKNAISLPDVQDWQFINDGAALPDKTYSSNKIEEKFSEVYIKDESTKLFSLKTYEHTHQNAAVLNLLTEQNGILYYNGSQVSIENTPYPYSNSKVDNNLTTLTQIYSTSSILSTIQRTLVKDSEIIISNAYDYVANDPDAASKVLNLVIYDNGLEELNVEIPAGQTQRYNLGISTKKTIWVKGYFSVNFYINAF